MVYYNFSVLMPHFEERNEHLREADPWYPRGATQPLTWQRTLLRLKLSFRLTPCDLITRQGKEVDVQRGMCLKLLEGKMSKKDKIHRRKVSDPIP